MALFSVAVNNKLLPIVGLVKHHNAVLFHKQKNATGSMRADQIGVVVAQGRGR
jgi:hypothetical protein